MAAPCCGETQMEPAELVETLETPGAVSSVSAQSASLTTLTSLADRLKALADPTRLRMLELLDEQPASFCVCDITREFAQHQPTISHHLRILRDAGLIRSEKRGVWSYYWATAEGKRSLSIARTLI